MSPRWLMAVFCLMLLMVRPVCPQISIVITVVKTALCAVSSGVFIAASCAKEERLLCRIIAFKLKLICRTFPCTNYGAPSQRRCAALPLGCAPWNIRPLGLCEPLRICCNRGGSFIDDDAGTLNSLTRLLGSRPKPSGKSAIFTPSENDNAYRPRGDNLIISEALAYKNMTGFRIPTTPQEYMKDWPENEEDDPATVEKTIKEQYVKFMKELFAVNTQEAEFGRETFRIPSFEEFRSVAIGETSII